MAKYVQPQTGQAGQDSRKQALLENLLKIEAEAASLANEAQAEVGRRIDEAERQNRARYEEQYGKAAAAQESSYQQEIDGVKAYYKKELDAYQESLSRITMDKARFSALMTALLAGET
jgi:F0F1-type ATP synthase membrane subunit b/b'